MKAISVPQDTSRRMRELLDLLRVSQVELAERVKISQPWVSKVLRSQQIRDTDAFKRFIRVVRQIVDEKTSLGLIEEEQLPNIQQTLRLLDAALGPRPTIVQPGGAIPPDAQNYVRRDVAEEAVSWLNQLPFTMAIEGPSDTGKTTVLGALAREARNAGLRVSFVDCKTTLKGKIDRLKDTEVGFLKPESLLATAILGAACAGWGLRVPEGVVENFASFVNQLADLVKPFFGSNILLILDGITSTVSKHPEYAEDLLRMIRFLHNSRATTHGIELSLAVSLTWHSRSIYTYVRESSTYGVFHPRIDVHWLTPQEVEALLSNLEGNVSAYLDILLEHYGGQPLLTHIATTRILEGNLMPNDVFAEALRGKGQFAYHIREVFQLLSEATSKARGILQTLCEGKQPDVDLFSEDLNFLVDTHLVVEDDKGQLAIPSKLYRQLVDSVLSKEVA